MVNHLNPQVENLFNDLINLLSAESAIDSGNNPFLAYVREKHIFITKTTDTEQVTEAIRGINRYADEFLFTDKNANKIKVIIEKIYDTANRS